MSHRRQAVALLSVLGLAACSSSGGTRGTASAAPGGRVDAVVQVVAAFYPLAWMAQRIGGDLIEVRDLTPAGAEPHDLELDADGVDAIYTAGLAIVVGRGFQPGVEDAARRRQGPTVSVLDVVLDGKETHADEGSGADSADPHVWLDPVLMARLAPAVEAGLARADPEHAIAYRAGASALRGDLEALDRAFANGLTGCARQLLVTSHEAFGRLAGRYGLTQEGIAGFSPDAEPDPKRLAELSDLVEKRGVTTVFTEELLPTDLADTLARQTGVTTAVLSPLESLTEKQRSGGADYLSVMASNLMAISLALGCPS